VAAVGEHSPASVKRAKTAGLAGINSVVGDVPGTAVDNERWSHVGRERIAGRRRKWRVASGEWRVKRKI
jgi:hypothetical protein